jgi:hypothetical protein
MEILVDKRIELLAVIQTMTQYWDNLALKYFNKKLFECKYKEDVDKYFNKYKNHETVKLYEELSNNVQDISTFINLVLCYSYPPNFVNVADVENNINYIDKQKIPLELLWHEIGHLTINDLTKNYIDQFDINCKIISNDFIKHFYTDIETIVNEYIIRAITIRLFEINFGEKTVENLIQDNIQKGFTEIESIKNYISKNCEKDNRFTRGESYKELMDYVINKI